MLNNLLQASDKSTGVQGGLKPLAIPQGADLMEFEEPVPLMEFFEPNDTLSTAPDITERLRDEGHLTILGALGDNPAVDLAGNEVDLALFELEAGDVVTFETSAIDSFGPDTVLRLFDGSGNELAVNDDFYGTNSRILFVAPSIGTYAIGVSSFGNFDYDPTVERSGSDGFDIGDYFLDVTLGAPFSDLSEPNDTISEAPGLSQRLREEGSLALTGFLGDNANLDQAGNDVDLALFEFTAGETVIFETAALGGFGLDTVLRVFDASGNELAVNDDFEWSDSRVEFVVPEDGLYAVGVSSYANFSYDPTSEGSGVDGFSTGDYVLNVSFGAPLVEPPVIVGTPWDDVLNVVGDRRIVFAGAGNDLTDTSQSLGDNTAFGGEGDDQLLAGTNDQAFGETGYDTLISLGSGNRLYGGEDSDILIAGFGDIVVGGNGDDLIFAGQGENHLTGGAGWDQFWVSVAGQPEQPNTISDFVPGEDFVVLAGLGLTFGDLRFAPTANGTVLNVASDFEDVRVVHFAGLVPEDLIASDFLFV